MQPQTGAPSLGAERVGACVLLAVAAAALAWASWKSRTLLLSLGGGSWAHLAAIRRTLEHGWFPGDAFYAGQATPPDYSLAHVAFALASRLTGIAPHELWTHSAPWLVLLAIAASFAWFRALARDERVAAAGAATVLLVQAPDPSWWRMPDPRALALVPFAGCLLLWVRGAGRDRLAPAIGAGVALGACFDVHVPTGAVCALSVGCLALASGAGLRRLLVTWGVGLLVAAPWIANFVERFLARDALRLEFFDRFPEAWALELDAVTLRAVRFDALSAALPPPLWVPALAGLGICVWRWRAGRASLAERHALVTTLAAAGLLLTPLYGVWLEIGRASPARPVLALLLPLLVGLGVAGAFDAIGAARVGRGVRALALVALAFALAATALATRRHVERFAETASRLLGPTLPLGGWDLAEQLARTGPTPRVVLSDPGTSLAWPYRVGSFVVDIPAASGSPFVDDRSRYLDVRHFFDPRAPLEDLEAILDRYAVDAVAIDASGRRSPVDRVLLERLRALPGFEDTGCCGELVVLRHR